MASNTSGTRLANLGTSGVRFPEQRFHGASIEAHHDPFEAGRRLSVVRNVTAISHGSQARAAARSKHFRSSAVRRKRSGRARSPMSSPLSGSMTAAASSAMSSGARRKMCAAAIASHAASSRPPIPNWGCRYSSWRNQRPKRIDWDTATCVAMPVFLVSTAGTANRV